MKKNTRPFALLLEPERVALIDAEHGLVIQEPPLAHLNPKGKWAYGSAAAGQPGCKSLQGSADFPLAGFFAWFLERVYPVKRQQLCLLSLESRRPLSISLWTHLFGQLGLREPLQLMSPIEPMAKALAASSRSGMLLYLGEGQAQLAGIRPSQVELSQVGYGFYLTRAIRQHVIERHRLPIDMPSAEQAWQRLGGTGDASSRQLTLEGRDPEGKVTRRLLIAEELEPLFSAAIEPLIREISHLQRPGELQLYGPQADLPWLLPVLKQRLQAAKLQQPLVLPPERERILMHSIQTYLKGL